LRTARINRLNVWLASMLLGPGRATPSMLVCIAVFFILGLFIVILMKPAENLFMDSTEAYAWGMQFLGGYGRHPPFTGWIARVWYSVFPATNWASYTLSRLMRCISLVSIFLIGQRVVGQRRATLVVFAMMLYPLFIGAKSDRFNNYQVLLAVLPLMVWLFLRAYEKPTARAGIALGLAAAAATLTIYSAAFGLIGVLLAAVLHPGRRKFFASPAPYVAAAVFLLAVSTHIVCLINQGFSSLRWAGSSFGGGGCQHFGLLAFCLIVPAIALWPWRWRANHSDAPFVGERPLVVIIAVVLAVGPVLLALVFNINLKLDWGNSLFFLVPIAVASLLPNILVTRQVVAKAAVIAAIVATAQLLGAPVFSWARFKVMPDDGPYRPMVEAAAEITQLWHDRFHSLLPIVVSGFEIAAPMVFYSTDHPKMFADFDPAYSPWIDYPAELNRKGFVGICFDEDRNCRAYLKSLNPEAEQLDIAPNDMCMELSPRR
jgi:4-amino-4-deoxy-L-arabinose transferase-like glycosyltransferase